MHKNPNHISDTRRDKSRRVDSKRCSMTRRAAPLAGRSLPGFSWLSRFLLNSRFEGSPINAGL